MRRLLTLLFLLSPAAFGYASFSGWCEQGGVKVTVQGLSSPSYFQQSYPNLAQSAAGPSVTVYFTGTTNKIPIYSDNTGTVLNNPFPCSSTGQYVFYSSATVADLLFSGSGVSSFTRVAVGGSATFPVYVTNYGAKCDGSTNDAVAINAAITAAPDGSDVYLPSNCVINSVITISKTIHLHSGAPAASPNFNLIAGAGSIDMIDVTNCGGCTVEDLSLNANGNASVNGIAWSGSSNGRIAHNIFSGAFAQTINIESSSFFNHIEDNGMHGVVAGILIQGQSNVNYVNNNSIFLNGSFGSGVTIHNGDTYTVAGNDFECGAQFSTYNSQALDIGPNHFESSGVGCPASSTATQWIGIGSAYAGTPTYGVHIHNNQFGGYVYWCVYIGDAQSVTVDNNLMGCDQYGINVDAQNTVGAATNPKTSLRWGDNYWNINNAGYSESTFVTYTNGGYTNTVNVNSTILEANPFLFPSTMPVPQTSHVPASDAAIYWNGGYLKMLANYSGTWLHRLSMLDSDCYTTGNTDGCFTGGAAIILPYGSVPGTPNTSNYSLVNIRSGTYNAYFAQDDAAGSQSGVAHAQYIGGDSTQPIVIGASGQAIYEKHLPGSAGSGGLYVCIDNTGKMYQKSSCP